jgi:hypothetical protein
MFDLRVPLVAVLLAGCVPIGVTPGTPGGDTCGSAAWQSYLGQPSAVLHSVRFQQPVRIIPAGAPVTQDFSPQRLNFDLDIRGNVVRVWCG